MDKRRTDGPHEPIPARRKNKMNAGNGRRKPRHYVVAAFIGAILSVTIAFVMVFVYKLFGGPRPPDWRTGIPAFLILGSLGGVTLEAGKRQEDHANKGDGTRMPMPYVAAAFKGAIISFATYFVMLFVYELYGGPGPEDERPGFVVAAILGTLAGIAIEARTRRESKQTPFVMRFGRWPRNKFQLDPNTGEWHRILHRGTSRHGPLLDQRARVQRVQEELEALQLRRKGLRGSLVQVFLCGAIVGGFYYWSSDWTTTPASGIRILGDATNVVAGVLRWLVILMGISLGMHDFLSHLWQETLYLCGFQWIEGAKVYDPEPVRPGREEAEKQKAHGDARTATKAEADAAGSGKVRRSSVHDQKF